MLVKEIPEKRIILGKDTEGRGPSLRVLKDFFRGL